MDSLSFETGHVFDNKLSAHMDTCSEAKLKGMKSAIRSSGFEIRTGGCRASAWEEKHGINHASLQDIDEDIVRWVPAVLAQELKQFEIYHRDGIFSWQTKQLPNFVDIAVFQQWS